MTTERIISYVPLTDEAAEALDFRKIELDPSAMGKVETEFQRGLYDDFPNTQAFKTCKQEMSNFAADHAHGACTPEAKAKRLEIFNIFLRATISAELSEAALARFGQVLSTDVGNKVTFAGFHEKDICQTIGPDTQTLSLIKVKDAAKKDGKKIAILRHSGFSYYDNNISKSRKHVPGERIKAASIPGSFYLYYEITDEAYVPLGYGFSTPELQKAFQEKFPNLPTAAVISFTSEISCATPAIVVAAVGFYCYFYLDMTAVGIAMMAVEGLIVVAGGIKMVQEKRKEKNTLPCAFFTESVIASTTRIGSEDDKLAPTHSPKIKPRVKNHVVQTSTSLPAQSNVHR